MDTPICRFCTYYSEHERLCTRIGSTWTVTNPVTGIATIHNNHPLAYMEREQHRMILPDWFPRMPWRCGPRGFFFRVVGSAHD